MKIPVVGRVYHRSLLARLADAMALLVAGNCEMPDCLRLGSAATGSETIKSQCEMLAERIEQGQNVIEAGQSCSAIPPLFFYSVQLGHQRNELQDNLYGLSEMYTEQTRINQSRLQALLLPLMLVIVGGVVAMATMAMFLPLVSMVNSMTG